MLSEQTGLEIGDEAGLMPCILELAHAKREYEKVRSALEQVEATGYGIVMPSIGELQLEQPEIVQQGGRYGVRLEACAPSIHMMKATIHTEISPIVGTEKQSEDLVRSLLADFADDPVKLWQSNIFGKSLHELVNDGLLVPSIDGSASFHLPVPTSYCLHVLLSTLEESPEWWSGLHGSSTRYRW